MFLDKELAETVIGTIVGEQVELKDSFTEYDVNTLKAYLSKVRFDVYARSKDDCVFTMDMQRRYLRSRIRNRSVYYGAKELSSQEVPDSYKYEDLRQVTIIFVLEENTSRDATPITKVQMTDVETGSVYSELLTLYEVNLNLLDTASGNMGIIKDFYSINTHDERLRMLLTVQYMKAIISDEVLQTLEGVEHFMIKNVETLLERERNEGKMMAASVIKYIMAGKSDDEIMHLTGATSEDVEDLRGILSGKVS